MLWTLTSSKVNVDLIYRNGWATNDKRSAQTCNGSKASEDKHGRVSHKRLPWQQLPCVSVWIWAGREIWDTPPETTSNRQESESWCCHTHTNNRVTLCISVGCCSVTGESAACTVSQGLVASALCAGTNLNLCVWPLTFAEVDRHALRLEQAVVLILGVALGQLRGVARWGLSQRVRQGGRGRRCRGRGRGGGGGGVYLAVDWRDVAWAARYGWSDELPAEAQQAAGHFVDVEGGSFCTGTRAGRTKVCEGKNERQKPTDRRGSVVCIGWIFSSNNSLLFVEKLLPNRMTSIQNEASNWMCSTTVNYSTYLPFWLQLHEMNIQQCIKELLSVPQFKLLEVCCQKINLTWHTKPKYGHRGNIMWNWSLLAQ